MDYKSAILSAPLSVGICGKKHTVFFYVKDIRAFSAKLCETLLEIITRNFFSRRLRR